jgi:hypothetical protein
VKEAEFLQLNQIYHKGKKGVWCGDLMDKCSARELVRAGYVRNTGGAPSSLDTLFVTDKGRTVFWRELEKRIP